MVVIAGVVGDTGLIEWGSIRPNPTPRKILEILKTYVSAWQPEIESINGIAATDR